jgi:hypothetical protein
MALGMLMLNRCHPLAPWRLGTLLAAALGVITAFPPAALAYRPFDGTDADVAEPNKVEVELQPVGAIRDGSAKSLIAPATVINIGFANRWEAVFEGQGLIPLSPSGPAEVIDAGMFLKHVLREGSLQGKSGLSLATEFGVLLPGINGDRGVGASLAGIASQRGEWGTVHFNAALALTRDQHADAFAGVIVEGPSKWTVRPVAELFYEETFGQARTVSALVGLIWKVRDDLSFDIGIRHAITNNRSVDEIRAGMTFGFPLQLTRLAGH